MKPVTNPLHPLPTPARLLTLKDTAALLGCSVKTLRRMHAARELPVVRVGRQLRVHPEDLARFIASRRD